MSRALMLLALTGCHGVPPPGTCEVPTTGNENVVVTPVALVGAPAFFDDLRFSPQLRKLVAAPDGTGQLFLVDPETMAVKMGDVPSGVGSADASATTVYVADRDGGRIVALDASTLDTLAAGDVYGAPDYVRVAPTTGEVWVTLPRNRIAILDPRTLAPIGSVDLPSPPEGLTFDATGRAYTNMLGSILVLDVARRAIVGEWRTGCRLPHGFPQVDPVYGLAIGGCGTGGGAAVTTMTGELRAGFEVGSGETVLAYDGARHHLYLRGDPGSTLDILATCPDGELGLLAGVAIPDSGHGAAADDRGHVWIADATTGGLLRVTDPYAGTR
jgi:hypothetical protein